MILRVADSSEVSVARRATGDLARELGLDETKSGRAALVVTEMATNLLKHAGGGDVRIETLHNGTRRGVRLTFSDRGPGIADIGLALTDGYTTGSGLGLGLGGAKRLSNEFAVESKPGNGTRVTLARWR